MVAEPLSATGWWNRRRNGAPLSEEQQEALQKLERCPECAGYHAFRCPFIEEIEFHPQGGLSRIKYFRRDKMIREILDSSGEPLYR